MCFFFQAEDGIRDYKVTGVQTCALPICRASRGGRVRWRGCARRRWGGRIRWRRGVRRRRTRRIGCRWCGGWGGGGGGGGGVGEGGRVWGGGVLLKKKKKYGWNGSTSTTE